MSEEGSRLDFKSWQIEDDGYGIESELRMGWSLNRFRYSTFTM